MSYEPITLVLAVTLCIGFLAMLGLVYGMAKLLFSAGETERLERVLSKRRTPAPSKASDDDVNVPQDTDRSATPKSIWTRVD